MGGVEGRLRSRGATREERRRRIEKEAPILHLAFLRWRLGLLAAAKKRGARGTEAKATAAWETGRGRWGAFISPGAEHFRTRHT